MLKSKGDVLILLWILAMLVLGALLYPHLPEQVPSHWNIKGEVDGYSGPFWGAFGLPLLTLACYVGMALLPQIDPRRENYRRFAASYNLFRRGMVLFFSVMYGVTLLAAFDYDVNVSLIIQISVALLFIFIGNMMGRFKFNYFVGIRTPWTLADEEVWRRTHRVGGRLWVIAGFIGLIAALLPPPANFILLMGSIGLASIGTIIYSYYVFRKKTG
ncbi:MAG: SdpI family protein [Limnochordia bacterium]|jgi:uncharacterized membrane protein